MRWILQKFIGNHNERILKKIWPVVEQINRIEEQYQSLEEDQLRAKTDEFRRRISDGESLDDLLPEAFAVVKNACRRMAGSEIDVCDQKMLWDMIPYDVQLVGGVVIHQGQIAEMATGEGKTLVATMPVYLNALTGKGVHLVTVNDYLARRDSQWMGALYGYLGLTVGCIQNQMSPDQRREEYSCDITYGTNSEFGFDYLRDNMAVRSEDQVQPGHPFAIIDEIDSILIDEARTPLIISGPAPYETKQYAELNPSVSRLVKKQRDLCNKLVAKAKKLLDEDDEEGAQLLLYQVHQGMPKNRQFLHMLEDPYIRRLFEKIDNAMLTDMRKEQARALREELLFTIDEKGHDANLTDRGRQVLSPNDPDAYVVPDIVTEMAKLDGDDTLDEEQKFEVRQKLQDEFGAKSEVIHAVDQLIRAHSVYESDVDYVVQNNKVVIVDENTGRLMVGRRWSDGLHQAVEAKEGVSVERESQTLATITIQNYFRMYDKLSGMTGTAETEADEFHQIYELDVVVIPTNRPIRRVDFDDRVYRTQREKYRALIDEIRAAHERRQPVLVGTISVEKSELISRMLKREKIPHNVLNAKNHQSEAEIVARAGQPGAVTIATNMAGRGTDIKLGEGVVGIDRETIVSDISLDDKYKGGTLKKWITENPCGLYVIASERHESRRVDRQLRGRCARQGDPGCSAFFISLEDDLMRLFGSDRISNIMQKLGIEEGEVLVHPWLNKSLQTAQRRVEQQNFAIRKRTLEYDDVMNKQREVIYEFRSEILRSENPREHLYELLRDVIQEEAEPIIGLGEDDLHGFIEWVNSTFPIGLSRDDLPDLKEMDADKLADEVFRPVKAAYELKAQMEDAAALMRMEKLIIMQAVDIHWQEYLRTMDTLRQGVGLRAYGQQDPLVEYKREAYSMFSDLMVKIKLDVAAKVFRSATNYDAFVSFVSSLPQRAVHNEVSSLGSESAEGERAFSNAMQKKPEPAVKSGPKVGRNDPCPCGSGKKYKKCCGS